MPSQTRLLYLHIGRGKTGTTALQRRLGAHRAVLADLGVHYPAAAGGAEGIGHDTFGKALIDPLPWYMKPPRDPEGALEAMRGELAATRADRALISTEQLELADPGRVRAFLDTVPGDWAVRVIYMVRSQDELAESEYNQLVRMRGLARPFADYATGEFDGDFLATARAWEAVFGPGNLIGAVYDARQPRTEAQILAGIGVADAATALPAPPPGHRDAAAAVNRSIGFRALTALRLLNGLGIAAREVAAAAEARAAAGNESAGDDPPALYFDAAGAAAFRARFAAANRGFGARYLGNAAADLGGRRYSDTERDAIRARIEALRLDRF